MQKPCVVLPVPPGLVGRGFCGHEHHLELSALPWQQRLQLLWALQHFAAADQPLPGHRQPGELLRLSSQGRRTALLGQSHLEPTRNWTKTSLSYSFFLKSSTSFHHLQPLNLIDLILSPAYLCGVGGGSSASWAPRHEEKDEEGEDQVLRVRSLPLKLHRAAEQIAFKTRLKTSSTLFSHRPPWHTSP